ncbi:PREDICTED: uncharacterized protein LOC108978526 [Bactrocera latifrons]|uniref:uncharacterized protein LOC108978526 n=1 Tax=Bactrocera latifrons TaxID=174628 RepID=UPI0008DCAFB1|nr:PREDICTED: uncharacterized protein LOC108978526 [Bactrocera latifrons]
MDVEETRTIYNTVRSEIATPKSSDPPVAAPKTRVMRPPPSDPKREKSSYWSHRGLHVPACAIAHCPSPLKRYTNFKSMKHSEPQLVARAHGHCMTYLADDHATIGCWADDACQYCQRPHHTLFYRFPRRTNLPEHHTNTRTRPRSDPIRRRRRTSPHHHVTSQHLITQQFTAYTNTHTRIKNST